MYKALTIAGSDTSGGAGIQADLKTFQEYDVYGMSAITVMVCQNPFANWRHDIFPIEINAIEAQIDTVLKGIGIDAMKTGMLPTPEVIELVARKLNEYKVENIVIDPVMVCKGTDDVVNPISTEAIKTKLLPLADIITPNIYETAQLTDIRKLDTVESLKEAAKVLHNMGAKNVFIKGGTKFASDKATDLFYDGKYFEVLESDIVNTTYTHGAGCTTAAAITAELAKGKSVKEAVISAKSFVTNAIANGFKLNEYVGAVRHSASRNQIRI